MIALLNMAIMDKTAMIRTAPINCILFPACYRPLPSDFFEADMSIPQEV